MSNMSYCRFQNTLSDLQDCEQALNEQYKLSDRELDAAVRLIKCCHRIAGMFEVDEMTTQDLRAALAESMKFDEED